MSNRQGPTESATKLPLREARFGNDNQIWQIIKSGKTKRWARQTTHTIIYGKRTKDHQTLPGVKSFTKSYYPASKVTSNKKYYIHDNRRRPFMVIVTKPEIIVYAGIFDFKTEAEIYKACVLTVKNYAGYWVGTHITNELGAKWARGNSILIKAENHKYIFVGHVIYQFETNDNIYDYHSEVGNNDVPYPIALGTDNTYFMIENHYISNSELKMDINLDNLENGNLMGYYYGHVDRYGKTYYDKKRKDQTQDSFKSQKFKKLKILSDRNLYSSNINVLKAMIKEVKQRKRRR